MTDPKPSASSELVRRQMSAQRTRDTGPELALRRELHRRGLRFRLQRRVLPGQRSRPDIVFGPAKVAVEVRGCFWHGCHEHGTVPKTNTRWWRDKITANVDRDERNATLLREAGWEVVIVWEHDDVVAAADRIGRLVRSRRQSTHRSGSN